MYRDIGYRKENHRGSILTQYSKRWLSTANTYSRTKEIQRKDQILLKQTPLSVSATSWIVITPNAFNSPQQSTKVQVKIENQIDLKNRL